QQQQQTQKQAQFESASLSTRTERHVGGLSRDDALAGRQHRTRLVGDAPGDGRTLNARESSARFWEEAESLDAQSSVANDDRRLGRGATAGSGCRDVGDETGGVLRSDRGNSRPGQPGRQREAAGWAGGPRPRGVRPGAGAGGVGVGVGGTAGRATIGSGGARGKSLRGVPRPPDLSLGQALRTMGGLIGGDGAKLSAVGKHLTSLGGVTPGVSTRATQLFLSNNSLGSLRGLDTFSGAVCLSLSHNLVRRTGDLRPLAALTRLETLSMEGNSVCGAANYRAHVISLVSPSLKTLDHREMLEVLQVESWPAFDQLEVNVLERVILDEAAEVFGESPFLGSQKGIQPLAFRAKREQRAAQHAFPGLCPCPPRLQFQAKPLRFVKIAAYKLAPTLGSPCTRMWAQVLGEVQRRAEGDQSGIVFRCEGVRRREAERCRHVSAQTNVVLQELTAAVGCSDNQWALPPYEAATMMRQADAPRGSTRSPHEHEQEMVPVGADQSCPSGVPSGISLSENPATPSPDAVEQEPAGLAQTGSTCREETNGGSGVRGQSDTCFGRESARAAGLSQGRGPKLIDERRRRQNEEEGGARSVESQPFHPAARAVSQTSATLGPSSGTGGVGSAAKAGAMTAAAALGRKGQTTTMASAAQVLLARAEADEGLGLTLGDSNEGAAVEKGVPKKAWVDVGDDTSRPSIVGGNGEGNQEEGRTLLSGWCANRESEGTPDGAAEIQSSRNTAGEVDGFEKARARESPGLHEMSLGASKASPGGGARGNQASSAAFAYPAKGAPSLVPGVDSTSPATGRKHNSALRQQSSGDEVYERRLKGGDSHAGLERRGSSSEATRRLLREALRVKRLLAAMDEEDDTADGLGDEDPERFLAGLGFVELKPLSTKLVEAFDRGPRPSLGDPSAAAAPGRNPGCMGIQLRVVAALGKEVVQRVEACAEARRLHATLRRQVEAARRARARNLDKVDVACRTLISKAGEEVQVLHESRRVAQEAERYHETLASLQEQVEVTIAETRKIISGSEALAWQLRTEMDGRGGTISARRRSAEEGLAEWKQATASNPDVRARRRAYDCEILVLRHRMGYRGANRSSLASFFCLLRARTEQQRRAREWFAEASARRNATLLRSAFGALARNSRSRAAEATAVAARCRAGLVAWKQAAARARRERESSWWREQAVAMRGLRQWRQRCRDAGGGGGGYARSEELEWRLELFRKHRAKRVNLTPLTCSAVESFDIQSEAYICVRSSVFANRIGGSVLRWVLVMSGLIELLRMGGKQALACRRRFETQVGLAFRWWLKVRRGRALARTIGQRRALRRWRCRVEEARSVREATTEATGSYVLSLGRRVLAAWSMAASTRARRRTGAARLVTALTLTSKRAFFERWAVQAAAVARESDNTVVALEHCYDRCLRGHLRAWQDVAKKRRVLRRFVLLSARRRCFRLRMKGLSPVFPSDCYLQPDAWAAAAGRGRRLASLTAVFSAWAATRRRVAVIHRLTRRAAARKRRLALAGGFRALRLAGRRATVTAPDPAERYRDTGDGDDTVGGALGDRHRPQDAEEFVGAAASAAVQEAASAKAAMEAKVASVKDRKKCGDGGASAAEGSFLPRGTHAGWTDLTSREGELFGKLQAETVELRQRAAAAAKKEDMLKAEGSRKSVQTAAALATALAEGDRLRAEAEEHEVILYIVAQLDLDTQQTAAQANTLSQRLAEAEQDLGFEVTRNAQRAQGTGEGNARLRASALAAAKRIAAAENALRNKGRAIEELRSKCAREGVGGFSRSKREQRSGGGGKRAAASPTSGLEFRVFAARADAQAAVERSTVAAVERRSAAGSLLAEALRAAGSETVTTMANEAGVDSCSSQGDDDRAARKLASASVANERREVAGLALRSAEAKMRRSADLTLRARFSHQPILNPKELVPEEAS
ncbi:unnamed protein product, partial [Scytosiphon promiscuus]